MSERLPVAEIFHSVQGEGQYAGTPMLFIRLAGCSVGKPQAGLPYLDQDDAHRLSELKVLKAGAKAWLCHTYDGRPFWCDTDFNKKLDATPEWLLSDCWEKHICLTGGEPLMHIDKLQGLVELAHSQGKMIHIETSGTIDWIPPFDQFWLTIAPKVGYVVGMIERADEIKLLVDKDFKSSLIPLCIQKHKNVYLQPVNFELEVDRENLELCLGMFKLFPGWKLSVQLHKFLNVR
jgi:7-carboxy-7-deazaguanine synthase